jgi:hypothetical protein
MVESCNSLHGCLTCAFSVNVAQEPPGKSSMALKPVHCNPNADELRSLVISPLQTNLDAGFEFFDWSTNS